MLARSGRIRTTVYDVLNTFSLWCLANHRNVPISFPGALQLGIRRDVVGRRPAGERRRILLVRNHILELPATRPEL